MFETCLISKLTAGIIGFNDYLAISDDNRTANYALVLTCNTLVKRGR